MIKTITKIGNSHGLIFDAALLDMARLKPGDQVNVTVHDGGAVVLTPRKTGPSKAEVSRVIKDTMRDYSRTMRRLA